LQIDTDWHIFVGMATVVTNIRLDKDLKAEATELFRDLGLTLSQAFTVFLKQAILHQGLPFAVQRPPSRELAAALAEGERLARDPDAKTYSTPQELWDELGI
jgi:DNA-damage-inducible protein J